MHVAASTFEENADYSRHNCSALPLQIIQIEAVNKTSFP